MVKKISKAFLRGGLTLVGVLIIGVIVWRTGWTGIRANLLLIGPWFLSLVALNLVAQAGFVIGLRNVLEPRPPWSAFPRLYGIYLMGDSANYLVPVGGEATKAHLLRPFGGGEAGMAAVALHKQADLLSQCAFAVAGVGAALVWFDLPSLFAAAAVIGTLALLALYVFLSWALGRGAFSPILRRLAAWKFLASRLERYHHRAASVDSRIASFHTAHRRRFLAAAAFCFLGYCGGVLEAWIVLRLLAPQAGWPARIVVEALPMVLNNAVLFLPGKLGGAEGIRTAVFVVIGLSASQGAAYSLVRRTRELLWVLPGWILLLRERHRGADGAMPLSPLRKEVTHA